MANEEILTLSIEKAHELFLSREMSVLDFVHAYQESAQKNSQPFNAYREIFENIDEEIEKAQKLFDTNQASLLTGIPIAVKDNILIQGRRAGASSRILEGYTGTYDATVITNLRKEGCVFLGRTNMDEFAMGSSTEHSAYGVTKNPYDDTRVPGGSSGGSAVAVATKSALVALGSDTGGSIRQPGAFCGIVGFMPTYGVVSRSGLMSMASSLDRIGPLARSVRDAEIVFNAISEYDPMDSTSYPPETRGNIVGKNKYRIGVPHSFVNQDGIEQSVKKNFEEVIKLLVKEGHDVVDIEIPLVEYSLAVYYILMPAEVSTNLSRFDGVRYGHSVSSEGHDESFAKSRGEGFGAEAKRRIMLGTYVLSHGYYDAYYTKAVAVRHAVSDGFSKAFKEVDCILTPTAPTTAFKIGERVQDPLSMYLADLFTVPANIAGIPAIAIPSGKDEQELPLSVQFMGPKFSEPLLFDLGKKVESMVSYG